VIRWSPDASGWNEDALSAAVERARAGQSSDLVVLQDDRVVVDERWQPEALPQDVASTQKSVTSVLVGIAVGKGLVTCDDRVSDHLGDGWTGRNPPEVERAITVDHLLTMTSGLADDLSFVAPPGQWWDYNLGAAYHTTKRVVAAAAGRSIEDLTREWLTDPLAMTETAWRPRRWDDRLPPRLRPSFEYPDGAPIEGLDTSARDLVRFGRSVLRECVREDGTPLGVDERYRVAMTRPSQGLNPSYGLLWWLNGQPWFLPPKVREPVERPFFPGVPPDAYAALGAQDRLCVVVPSLDLVIARTGAAAGEPGAAGSAFVRELVAAVVAASPS
jgi:CubicO group peptidase (beta-lactamase class C family)